MDMDVKTRSTQQSNKGWLHRTNLRCMGQVELLSLLLFIS